MGFSLFFTWSLKYIIFGQTLELELKSQKTLHVEETEKLSSVHVQNIQVQKDDAKVLLRHEYSKQEKLTSLVQEIEQDMER